MPLTDKQGHTVQIQAYGIDRITADIDNIDVRSVLSLFKGVSLNDVERQRGQVDLLIGC